VKGHNNEYPPNLLLSKKQSMVATSLPAPVLETGPQIIKIESKADEYGVVKLHPVQMRFITGIAKAYDDDFPPELFNLVSLAKD
jgi:hypothetical protein